MKSDVHTSFGDAEIVVKEIEASDSLGQGFMLPLKTFLRFQARQEARSATADAQDTVPHAQDVLKQTKYAQDKARRVR